LVVSWGIIVVDGELLWL